MMKNSRFAIAIVLLVSMMAILAGCVSTNASKTINPTAKPTTATQAPKIDSTPQIKLTDGVQEVRIKLTTRGYAPITVYKDIPVRFIVEAQQKDITSCNNKIVIPTYNVQSDTLRAGENVIEFTPTKLGKVAYSCWMGMIRSNITVIEKP